LWRGAAVTASASKTEDTCSNPEKDLVVFMYAFKSYVH
jgi:hypothetical protein